MLRLPRKFLGPDGCFDDVAVILWLVQWCPIEDDDVASGVVDKEGEGLADVGSEGGEPGGGRGGQTGNRHTDRRRRWSVRHVVLW